ncbi:hypothetical protein OB13_19660, partial [Pontibacter sp. HJ8]
MYISLYTAKQLDEIKEKMLWLGLFMLSGGLAALFNDMVVQATRWDWVIAAFLVSLTGAGLVAIGVDKLPLKDAYFSITTARISYRLNLYSQERMIYWRQIAGIQVSDRFILIDLNSGRQVLLRLRTIQNSNTAHQIAVNVQLAALERNVTVNGVN